MLDGFLSEAFLSYVLFALRKLLREKANVMFLRTVSGAEPTLSALLRKGVKMR